MRAVLDEYRRSRADRRDLSAARAAGRPTTARTSPACICRSTSSSSTPPGTRAAIASADRANTKSAAARRLAELGARQSRPAAHRGARRAAQARVAAMLLLTLRGTPTMYYGDEIGMPRVEIPPERVQDPWEKNEPGLGVGRDPSRTPMQWDASPNAGFTTGHTLASHRSGVSRTQCGDAAPGPALGPVALPAPHRDSNAHRALSIGSARVLGAEGNVLSFERSYEAERILVALNFGDDSFALPDSIARKLRPAVDAYGCGRTARRSNAAWQRGHYPSDEFLTAAFRTRCA